MLSQNINLTTNKKPVTPVVHMVQNDSGRKLVCTVYDYTSVASGALSVELPSGTVYTATGTISSSTDHITFSCDITNSMLAEVGKVKATVKLFNASSQLVSTHMLYIDVEESAGFNHPITPQNDKIYVVIDGQNIELAKQPQVDTLQTDVTNLKEDLSQIINAEYPKDICPIAYNGSYNGSGGLTNVPTRIRSAMTPVKKGDTISVANGSYIHAIGIWKGTLSAETNVRNDSSWQISDEKFVIADDGYFVIVFSKPNYTGNLNPADFNGEVSICHTSKLIDTVKETSENVSTITPTIDLLINNFMDSSNAISLDTIVNNYRVTDEGYAINISGYRLYKYTVEGGTVIKIKTHGDAKMMFQKNTSSIPSHLPNENLVGNVFGGVYDKFVSIPKDANYLIISQTSDIATPDVYTSVIKKSFDNNIGIHVLADEPITGTSGESILVKTSTKNILMDTHTPQMYWKIVELLRANNATKIDYLIISHWHNDHTGALEYWCDNDYYFDRYVDLSNATVICPPEITEDAIARITETGEVPSILVNRQNKILTKLASLGCKIIRPTENQEIIIDDVIFRFNNCDHSIYMTGGAYVTPNYNDFSIICTVEYGNQRFLNVADIGTISQRVLGGTLKPCNIMTAPHHGWDNGANNLIPAFINNVNPSCIVSPNGSPHYPSPDNTNNANVLKPSSATQSWCERNNVPNYMTCTNGTINLVMSKDSYKFNGNYSKFIRNGKNWKYTDNSEYIEN